MNMIQLIYLVIVFLIVFGVTLAILLQLSKRPLAERLGIIAGEAVREAAPPSKAAPLWVQRIVKLTGPLARLVLPKEGWEDSRLRIRFMNAGYRGEEAVAAFFAIKVLLALVLPGVAVVYLGISMAQFNPAAILPVLLAAAAMGYFAPNVFLMWRTHIRKREIFENFPDALDLMTVCVEAGLGMDAALAKVGDEMRLKSMSLAEEMHLVNLEMRAGSGREKALRNLALRTGVEEIDSLVAMLVQSDRFGTSIADSLRVHADSLRSKRRLRAEELAAKLPVKMLFPLLLCIFPALMLVLLGPSFITIFRVLLPVLAGASLQM